MGDWADELGYHLARHANNHHGTSYSGHPHKAHELGAAGKHHFHFLAQTIEEHEDEGVALTMVSCREATCV
jgi:hypothetical protein